MTQEQYNTLQLAKRLCVCYYIDMKTLVAVLLIGIWILVASNLGADTYHPVFGYTYCEICHRMLSIADKNGCRKANKDYPDFMSYATCNATPEPVLLNCPFDNGIFHLETGE